MARRSHAVYEFPSRWVKVAFALSGSLLLILLALWLAVMWAAAGAGG